MATRSPTTRSALSPSIGPEILKKNEGLLLEILSQPTAPFREGHVIRTITEILTKAGVPWCSDPAENLIVGVDSLTEYRRLIQATSPEPLRVFIAHLDHPGFHGLRFKTPELLEVQWHGGAPTQHLVGASVWVADRKGSVAQGQLREFKLTPSGRSIESALISLPQEDRREDWRRPLASEKGFAASELYGSFSFRAPVWKETNLLYTKAADDLVGAFAITALAIEKLRGARGKRKVPAPWVGLLTRAEEVGYIGAIAHFEKRYLQRAKRPVLCVSLETSRTFPGAEIGKGPVVRLGDRFSVFHPAATRVFLERAMQALPDAHQRRVMDGGTCEGTAAMSYGFPTIGISIPLGNYHNQSFEGGPDSRGANGPAPEFVHLQDIAGLLTLCDAILAPGYRWNRVYSDKVKEFKKYLRSYSKQMKAGP